MIDGDRNRHTKLAKVTDMTFKIFAAVAQGLNVFSTEICFGNAALHLQRFDRSNQHNGVWRQSCLTALDIEKLLGTKVRAEASFCYHVVRQLHRSLGRDHGVAAVRNIGKRTAVHKGRVVFHCLYEIRLKRILQ